MNEKERKQLWFYIAINCFKTCNPEISRKHAELVINNIKTKEEYEYVKELLELNPR